MAMRIEDKLGCTRFLPDEHNSHIEVDLDCTDRAAVKQVVMACPANLYLLDENGKLSFNHEGCLECGTCRVLCGGTVVKSWNHPVGSMGVAFRMG